jgi:predicted NAD/FAD-binding protein
MAQPRKRIAIVGAGVAGLGAAFALKDVADIIVYEKADRIGGHAWTIDMKDEAGSTPVDVGFICYNEPNYPNFKGLLEHLNVSSIATDMSFAVSDPRGFEWGSDPWGLFAWKRNLWNAEFHGLLREILRFNTRARDALAADNIPDVSLGEWLDQHGFSKRFRDAYLLPMSAAIWSAAERDMPAYPAESFFRFFDNHRLMHLQRPEWRTVKGGSRAYVEALAAQLPAGSVHTNARLSAVRPLAGGRVSIEHQDGARQMFDHVIFASHANEARDLLDPAFEEQRLALGSIRFSRNQAYLHRDRDLMPRRRAAWASWNVLKGQEDTVCVTYWMNRLQKLATRQQVFVTLNPTKPPREDLIEREFVFEHPIYDTPSAAARRAVQRIQGRQGLSFAGAWLGDGFHEAGLRTGLEAAHALGGSVPWQADLRVTHPLQTQSAPDEQIAAAL